jgi:alpha-glucosidase
VVRHPFLHDPDDPNTWGLRWQFLLGPDLLVAPVLDRGATAVEVYFPHEGDWLDLWTGAPVGVNGAWSRHPAPLGRPAVFLRGSGAHAPAILDGLRRSGSLAW